MKGKRKISVRRVLQALVTLIVTSGCLVAVLAASKKQSSEKVSEILINVNKGQKFLFIDKDGLRKELVDLKGIKEKVTPITRINIKEIEQEAYTDPWVSKAHVYLDNESKLHINVWQKVPVARVFFENGQSFYLDQSLQLLPLSDMFTYYTTIVTNVPLFNNDSLDNDMRARLLKLVRFIDRDTFWSAQVAQVIVTEKRDFELVPVLGNQKIIFGDTVNMENKFKGLFAFYKNVLNKIGWDKYEVLDLRYKDQVVATPAIPYKVNSRNALSNMDWIKNIMEEAPKSDTGIVMSAVQVDRPVAAAVAPKPAAKPVATSVVKTATKPVPTKKPEQQKKTTTEKTTKEKKTTSTQNGNSQPKYIYQNNY